MQRIINTALPRGAVPNDRFGYGIVRIHEAVDAAHDPVPASAPNPVYQAFLDWLRTPQAQSPSARSSPRGAAAPASSGGPARLAAAGAGAAAAVVLAAAAALLIIVRRRRRRQAGTPGGSSAPGPGGT